MIMTAFRKPGYMQVRGRYSNLLLIMQVRRRLHAEGLLQDHGRIEEARFDRSNAG